MKISEENAKGLKIICENFKVLRNARGYTMEELSKISDISTKILTDIENGQDFDVRYLFKLCCVYQIKPYEIFSPV